MSTAVGGGISAGTTYVLAVRNERTQALRDRLNERKVARGVARVLERDFKKAQAQLRACRQQRAWWPQEDPLVRPIPLEDRKSIASLLDDAGWDAVAAAESALALLDMAKAIDAPWSDRVNDMFSASIEALEAAGNELRRLSTFGPGDADGDVAHGRRWRRRPSS